MYSRPSASCCQNEYCNCSKQGCCSTIRAASSTQCTLSSSIVALGQPWKHKLVFFFCQDFFFFESRKEGIREGEGSLQKQGTETETYGKSTCFAMFLKHVSETLTEKPNAGSLMCILLYFSFIWHMFSVAHNVPWSIAWVPSSQAIPGSGYLITAHHLWAFLLYLAR